MAKQAYTTNGVTELKDLPDTRFARRLRFKLRAPRVLRAHVFGRHRRPSRVELERGARRLGL